MLRHPDSRDPPFGKTESSNGASLKVFLSCALMEYAGHIAIRGAILRLILGMMRHSVLLFYFVENKQKFASSSTS